MRCTKFGTLFSEKMAAANIQQRPDLRHSRSHLERIRSVNTADGSEDVGHERPQSLVHVKVNVESVIHDLSPFDLLERV
jgi:hypothetical protein